MGALADVAIFSITETRDSLIQEFLWRHQPKMKAYGLKSDRSKHWLGVFIESISPAPNNHGVTLGVRFSDDLNQLGALLVLSNEVLEYIRPKAGGYLLFHKWVRARDPGPVLMMQLSSKQELDQNFDEKINVHIGVYSPAEFGMGTMATQTGIFMANHAKPLRLFKVHESSRSWRGFEIAEIRGCSSDFEGDEPGTAKMIRPKDPVTGGVMNTWFFCDQKFMTEKKPQVGGWILISEDAPHEVNYYLIENDLQDVFKYTESPLNSGAKVSKVALEPTSLTTLLSIMGVYTADYQVCAAVITDVVQSPADMPSPYKHGSWDLHLAVPSQDETPKKVTVSHDWYTHFKPKMFDVLIAEPADGEEVKLSLLPRKDFDLKYKSIRKAPITPSIPQAPTHSHLTMAPDTKSVITLDARTRVQLAIILLHNGTPQQQKDAGLFLAEMNPEWLKTTR